MATRELEILLSLKDQATKELGKFSDSLEKMQPAFKTMATVGTAAFGAIAGAVGLSVKAYADSEAQLARVDAIVSTFTQKTLSQFSGGAKQASEIIKEFGSEIQALGGIADEDASEGMAKLLQITEDSTKAMEGASLAADLATFKQIDYSTAVDIVGKVMAGNTSILTRYGIVLDENTTKEEALAELTRRVGGQYEKYGKTLNGQLKILKESFGDVREEVGRAFVPILQTAIDKIKPVIALVANWAKENPELIKTLTLTALAISGVVAVIGTLGLILPSIITGISLLLTPLGLTVAVLAGVTGAVIYFKDEIIKLWDTIKDNTLIQAMVTGFSMLWESIKQLGTAFTELWVLIDEEVMFVLKVFGAFLVGTLYVAIMAIVGVLLVLAETFKWVVTRWKEDVEAFKTNIGILVDAWKNAKDNILWVWDIIKEGMKSAYDWIVKNVFDPMVKAIDRIISAVQRARDAVGSIGGKVSGAVKTVISKVTPFADGGIVTKPTMGLVGEAGAEAIIPLSKLNDISGRSLNITITGNTFMGNEDVAEKVGDMIMKRLSMNFKMS